MSGFQPYEGPNEIVERLRAELSKKFEESAAAIKERDEARRWLCEVLSSPDKVTGLAMPGLGTPRDFAAENGWDCYEKEGGGA